MNLFADQPTTNPSLCILRERSFSDIYLPSSSPDKYDKKSSPVAAELANENMLGSSEVEESYKKTSTPSRILT